jgi:hypothetical protein
LFLKKIWSGIALLLLQTLLFAVSLRIWAHNKINYAFIFEFDPRQHLNHRQFIEVSIHSPFFISEKKIELSVPDTSIFSSDFQYMFMVQYTRLLARPTRHGSLSDYIYRLGGRYFFQPHENVLWARQRLLSVNPCKIFLFFSENIFKLSLAAIEY